MTGPNSLQLYGEAAELRMLLEAGEGELTPEIEQRIDAFLDDSEDKLDRHRAVIADFSKRAELYDAEVKRLTERSRMLKRVVYRVKELAKVVLDGRVQLHGWEDGRKVETEAGIVYLNRTKALVIPDEAAFQDAYRTHPKYIKRSTSINKAAVKDAIKAGEAVAHALMEERTHVVFK